MFIVLGALCGILGFLPLFASLKLSRRSTSTNSLTVGLYGLAGVAVSLVVLIAALVTCGMLARESIVPFALAEDAVFLGLSIVYVVYRNTRTKRRRAQ